MADDGIKQEVIKLPKHLAEANGIGCAMKPKIFITGLMLKFMKFQLKQIL
ncbi:hypothetical protein ACT691_13520 [Vibrio metschnikovii]